jgi:hypothetical protein
MAAATAAASSEEAVKVSDGARRSLLDFGLRLRAGLIR